MTHYYVYYYLYIFCRP